MPLDANPIKIEPGSMQITGAHPIAANLGQVFYLGYGRNAWNWTWVNKYDPASLSTDVTKLKLLAEGRRVQGSVFNIQSVPLLKVQYPKNSFGIVPINEKTGSAYNVLIAAIRGQPPLRFWHHLPSADRNWLLVFCLTSSFQAARNFEPSMLTSSSRGGNYRLGWSSASAPPSFLEFRKFADFLAEFLRGSFSQISDEE